MRTKQTGISCISAGLLLLTHPALAGGWLGLTIQPPQGVQVAEIFKESPADRCGLKKGDLIRQIDGTPIRSMDHFTDTIAHTPAGKEITLVVWRRGEEIPIKATLDNGDEHDLPPQTATHHWPQPAPGSIPSAPSLPPLPNPSIGERHGPADWSTPLIPREERVRPPAPTAWLGVATEAAAGGVAILDVAPQSPAELSELKAGDLIVAINRQSVTSPEALVQTLGTMRPGDLVEITFNRNGRTLMSQVQLQRVPVNP